MKSFFYLFIILFFGACHQNSERNKETTISQKPFHKINSTTELAKWKKDLFDKRILGTPCGNPEFAENRAKWAEENFQEVMNGLPQNEKDYHLIYSDFNNDKKEDLLMFFESQNCTGHNGHVSPNFAKVIYSDGTVNADLAKDIYVGILKEFNNRRKKDPSLKEVLEAYLETDTSIETYKNGELSGIYSLYGLYDGHCCPSYSGRYTYNITTQTTSLIINKNPKNS